MSSHRSNQVPSVLHSSGSKRIAFMMYTHVEKLAQVPNHVRMIRERLPRRHLVNYAAKMQQVQIWKGAAQLWARGVPWEDAMTMFSDTLAVTENS